jgi:hypothetical protein
MIANARRSIEGVGEHPAFPRRPVWSAADLLLATAAVLVLLPPGARAWLRG